MGPTGDLLVKNAALIDGTGAPAKRGEILVKAGRIEMVGDLPRAAAARTVDATGLVASPGFIDTHAHTDLTLLDDPVHECLLRQGITTVIMGQDGLSYAPLSEPNQRLFRRYLKGLNGDARANPRWESVSEYRALFDRRAALNTAYAVPHGALRLETLGFVDAPLEGEALRRARKLLEVGLEEGAVAFSTGLSYFPGTYATTSELVHLSEVAAHAGRPYVTHLRTVFDPPVADFVQEGLKEALAIGLRSGAAVHVSHYGAKPWRYPSNAELLRPVGAARERGARVTFELYPYPSGNTFLLIHLPPWAHHGGPGALLERLRSPALRGRLAREIEENTVAPFGYQVAYVPGAEHHHLLGLTIDEIARKRQASVGETVIDLLAEMDLAVGGREGLPPVEDPFTPHRRATLELLTRGDYMIGSDAVPAALYPHPRTYGTFPRVLRFARGSSQLSLERAVHLMTELPARTFGLTERGALKPGFAADIALFDPQLFTDHATYGEPARHATGLEHLFVNGEAVISGGRLTDATPGRAVP